MPDVCGCIDDRGIVSGVSYTSFDAQEEGRFARRTRGGGVADDVARRKSCLQYCNFVAVEQKFSTD